MTTDCLPDEMACVKAPLIVVCEDSQSSRDVLAHLLREEGYEVSEFGEGTSVIESSATILL